jgi:hypothetical protein
MLTFDKVKFEAEMAHTRSGCADQGRGMCTGWNSGAGAAVVYK